MTDKEKIKNIIELFIAWNGEIDVIDVANIDSAVEFIVNSLQKEPISEDLEEAANKWNTKASFTPFYMTLDNNGNPNGVEQDFTTHAESFKAGAKWQITKLMKDATEVTVHIDAGGYPYTPEIELYDYDKDVPLAKEGDKYKVVLIKED